MLLRLFVYGARARPVEPVYSLPSPFVLRPADRRFLVGIVPLRRDTNSRSDPCDYLSTICHTMCPNVARCWAVRTSARSLKRGTVQSV